MSEIRDQIRQLALDRHSAESKALFITLIKYVESRVKTVARNTASDLLAGSELEEIVSDVMLQLMSGSLAQFRGGTLPELLAYVRTVTDRRLWRVGRRKIKERKALELLDAEVSRAWSRTIAPPDEQVVIIPETPLSEQDQVYLRDLLHAGSKAAYARENSLSRAAVTQRVQRIRKRIDALDAMEQMAVDAWLRHTARNVLSEQVADGVG